MEFSAKDLVISAYPERPAGGMQTGHVSRGIRIVHVPTGISVVCEKHHQPHKNREDALKMLQKALEEQIDLDREISNAHLGAAGWEMTQFNHSNPFDSVFIYLCDIDRNSYQLFSVPRSDFAEFQDLDAPITYLAHLIAESLEFAYRSPEHKMSDNTFIFKVMAYVKGTKCYRLWLAQGVEQLHFVINLYHTQKGVEHAMLRPFVANANETVISANSLKEYAQEVLKLDREHMPQWFDV